MMAGVSPLEDAGFFGRDLLERVAEKIGMIDRNGRDDGGERTIDHVGRVEPAAEADFEQQHVGRMAREQQHAAAVVISNTVIGSPPLTRSHSSSVAPSSSSLTSAPAEPVALVETHQMRRGIDMHALAGGLQDRAHEGDGRALAVGAGDVDHRRQVPLGMAERGEQPLDAVERQVDALGMQRQRAARRSRRPAASWRSAHACAGTGNCGSAPGAGALVSSRTDRKASRAICGGAPPCRPCRAPADIRRAGSLPAVSRGWSAR